MENVRTISIPNSNSRNKPLIVKSESIPSFLDSPSSTFRMNHISE